MEAMTHNQLKQRHRKEREGYHASLNLRVHRALSWLDRSEQWRKDLDARFVFLWNAFNAVYGSQLSAEGTAAENRVLKNFLARILCLDTGKLIDTMLWRKYSGPIRLLLQNPYVSPACWKSQNGTLAPDVWEPLFRKAKRQAEQALGKQATLTLPSVLLPRIYMLRNQLISMLNNQLVHGDPTWQSQVNRDQVRDCTALMAEFVPLVIQIMMDNPAVEWEPPAYPVVQADSSLRVQ